MPRRRAMRVIGVSLVAVAVPGVGPRLARAQSGVCLSTTCGKDRRCCQKGAEENFRTYCCPSPSWQWFCGGQDNGYRCINTCPRGAKTFPCTALIAHPESGINGVCCDRRIHSGCVPIGPPREKRPDGTFVPSQEWKPSCCPKGAGFGFCNETCCQAPNRCKGGRCRCPNGAESCDGRRCCKAGDACRACFHFGTEFSPRPNDQHTPSSAASVAPSPRRGAAGRHAARSSDAAARSAVDTPSRSARAPAVRKSAVLGNEQPWPAASGRAALSAQWPRRESTAVVLRTTRRAAEGRGFPRSTAERSSACEGRASTRERRALLRRSRADAGGADAAAARRTRPRRLTRCARRPGRFAEDRAGRSLEAWKARRPRSGDVSGRLHVRSGRDVLRGAERAGRVQLSQTEPGVLLRKRVMRSGETEVPLPVARSGRHVRAEMPPGVRPQLEELRADLLSATRALRRRSEGHMHLVRAGGQTDLSVVRLQNVRDLLPGLPRLEEQLLRQSDHHRLLRRGADMQGHRQTGSVRVHRPARNAASGAASADRCVATGSAVRRGRSARPRSSSWTISTR